MKLHRLHRKQRLPVSSEEAWAFFADPQNLPLITPPWLDFQLTSAVPERMHPGLILTYTIRPFLGFKVRWVTEITHVDTPHFFVDEQRFGPYRFWHHQHHFRDVKGGVEVEDIVHYALPLGPLGTLMHRFVVGGRLEEIFSYRREVLSQRFGSMNPKSKRIVG